jgi:hypothetical protein
MKLWSDFEIEAYILELGSIHYTVYKLYVRKVFSCYQMKGYDVYANEDGSYYVWDSRSLEETYGFESFLEAIRFCI